MLPSYTGIYKPTYHPPPSSSSNTHTKTYITEIQNGSHPSMSANITGGNIITSDLLIGIPNLPQTACTPSTTDERPHSVRIRSVVGDPHKNVAYQWLSLVAAACTGTPWVSLRSHHTRKQHHDCTKERRRLEVTPTGSRVRSRKLHAFGLARGTRTRATPARRQNWPARYHACAFYR